MSNSTLSESGLKNVKRGPEKLWWRIVHTNAFAFVAEIFSHLCSIKTVSQKRSVNTLRSLLCNGANSACSLRWHLFTLSDLICR